MRPFIMTLKPFWLIPDQILVHDYGEAPTAGAFLELIAETCTCLDTATHPVYLIADWRQATRLPLNFDMIGAVSKMLRHRNLDIIFILGFNPVISFWVDVYARLTGFRWKRANDYDEVIEVISQLATVAQR